MTQIIKVMKRKIWTKKIIFLLIILIVLLITIITTNRKLVDKESLRTLAEKNNFSIGTAVNGSSFLNDSQYRHTLKTEFNVITLENELKFVNVHPQSNMYNFILPDYIVDFAMKNNQKVRGHTLVWQNGLPDWINYSNYTRDQLKVILKNHIQTVVGHYKGKIYAWDVVNEAFNDNGSLRDNIWLRKIGPEYIELAFQWAHEADPNALLFYNDDRNDSLNDKSNAIYETFKSLKERGIPIDGIGFQTHTSINNVRDYNSISKNIVRLSKIGLQVQITEMDVKIQDSDDSTKIRLDKQAKLYADTLKICLTHKNCNAFVTWGFTDKYTWIPSYTGRDDKPLIFDSKYKPKPSYNSLYEVLFKKDGENEVFD
ncbi:endo-1,4-beta-xylanase [Bacillus sp. AFS096315]|uniref:endo-1,4-beta-xylanase n=1 Tax=Bacillus sp. AFS096315 TaxID=2033517 RepID=UPI000BEE810E|nr:endo-1,4-beta-xylanase [Bacillus sp. AFS096315]PEC51944.1 1,4-beta-xylanase [Bacillus sp. AFS096315]